MRFGYACLNLSITARSNHRCVLKNASSATLRRLISQNLNGLRAILEYNAARNILLFRISSDVIPFASHPINQIKWEDEFAPELGLLGEIVDKYDMVVSMHPGQYTIINSPHLQVVRNSLAELDYHRRFLDALSDSSRHKIVVHVGGLYGDKARAKRRFIEQSRDMCPALKRRLVIENDDRLFTAADVLELSSQTGLPMVFDYLHHLANPSGTGRVAEWLAWARGTWKPHDGDYKLHYSDQDPQKKKGSHAQSIDMEKLGRFLAELPDYRVNIMLEGKDKNLSVERVMAFFPWDKLARRSVYLNPLVFDNEAQ